MSVVIKGVSKSFGGNKVLSDVDLSVERGELFSIVGPSGSGKTTLLRIVAGLEVQDSGHVYIDGRLVDGVPPNRRNVGMVFQNYALYPNRSVAENIASPLLVRGVRREVAFGEVEELAKRLGLEDVLDRFPSQISGGQQQRVALARALVKKPDVFLLDEPLSNLDAQLRFNARKFVRQLQRDLGITTIYVTHDQSEALSISDRIAVMSRGRVMQVGSPRELYEAPMNEFVASFIGVPPLNVVDVRGGLPFRLPVKFNGECVKVGIRPEAIRLGEGEDRATVELVEYSGSEAVVYIRVGDLELRALSFGKRCPSVGESVGFSVEEGGVYLFDEQGRLLKAFK
ncbi:MAG: ABC transporter ATP-binding protein [Thermoprotei archaeon]